MVIEGWKIINNTEIQDKGLHVYRRYLDGDEDALGELIDIYHSGLLLFINGIVRDLPHAEELMIDAFAQFAVKGKQFEGRSSMKTYLYAIGRNLAIRHLKKHKHNQHFTLDDNHPAQDTPELEYLRGEDKRQLYNAMRQLKAEHRETLYLLYFEEMSYIEAGKVLGKTEKQISDLAYRGKAALKTKMENGANGHED
ncbi:sigma-70 family RNA polymerase sigma factor [Christensenellaceae bacterium OttesenSCG-928-K19]|nr:sigma-70 family RNA polymerase sigma factor [Christensenellaceae bacterium OttesenSCG-928-K19]